MACKITYADNGSIKSVKTESGDESLLFRSIQSLPFVENKEDALSLYQGVSNLEGGNFTFKVGENNYGTYKEALQQGQDFQVGVVDAEGEFKNISSIPYNVNSETYEGFINEAILADRVKDTKTEHLGKTYLVPDGSNFAQSRIKQYSFKQDAKGQFGAKNVSTIEGFIELNKPKKRTHLSEEQNTIIKELTSEMTRRSNKRQGSVAPQIDEENLRLKFENLLNKMGVETLTIDQYKERYKQKNGVELSSNVIADTANRVVAFKEGNIGIEDLTEEVMHFITASLDPTLTEDIMRNIHLSKEYVEFAAQYTEVYSRENPNMSKEEVEKAVRMEVLGKIMKNATLNLTQEPAQRNFYQKAGEFIKNFFDRISLKGNYKSELSSINNIIESIFLKDNLSEYIGDNINYSFRFYNLNTQGTTDDPELDRLRNYNKKLLESLDEAVSTARRGGKNLADTALKVKNYLLRKHETLKGKAALDFTAMANNLLSFVEGELEISESNNTPVSLEARDIIINLKDNVFDVLTSISTISKSKTAQDIGIGDGLNERESIEAKKKFLAKIEETQKKIKELSGRQQNNEQTIFKGVVERIKEKYGLDDSYTDFAMAQAATMNSEVSVFMQLFGQMNNTSDGLLNIMSTLVEEMRGSATEYEQQLYRPFVDRMEKLGYNAKDISEFYDNGYIYNLIDYPKFEADIESAKLKTYKKVTKKSVSTEQFKEMLTKGLSDYMDASELALYNVNLKENVSEFIERPNNDEYYKEKEGKYDKLNISQATRKFLSALSFERGSVQRKVMDDKNRPVYTENDKKRLDSISQERKLAKSMFSGLTTLKEGIVESDIIPDNTEYFEKGGLFYSIKEGASEDAIVAFDINRIDADFSESGGQSTNIKDFIKKGEEIGEKEMLNATVDFYRNNMGIVFTREFWDQASGMSSLDEFQESHSEEVFKIRKLQNRLSDVQRRYQDHQNPAEINGDEMAKTDKEEVKELVESISEHYNLLPTSQIEREPFQGVKDINASYARALKRESIQENSQAELSFIKENMSSKASSDAEFRVAQGRRMDAGQVIKGTTSETLIDFVEENGGTHTEAAFAISRQKMLPYFKRTSPQGYSTINQVVERAKAEGLNNREVTKELSEYINGIAEDPNFEFNVHYSYREEEKDSLNRSFNPNFKGGVFQPKMDKYKNSKFHDEFGLKEVLDDKGRPIDYTATKNLKKYEALQEVYALKQSIFDYMEVPNSENLYKAPQISKTNTNKLSDFLGRDGKGTTLKETMKDFLEYRVDDLEYGVENNRRKKQIPKMFIRSLENQQDVSPDLFYSLSAMTQQAALFKARKEGMSDALALQDLMLQREVPQGKEAADTENYKMLKSYLDYNYFGVKESKEFKIPIPGFGERDVTKVIRLFHKMIRLKSLGYNLIVPLTSLTTGRAQLFIEKKIKEYVSPDAYNMSWKTFKQLSSEAMKTDNSLGYNDKSKLNVLAEFMDINEMTRKARNAKYGKFARFMGDSAMVSHQMANFPVIPQSMLSAIMDYRVVNGKIVSRNEFNKSLRGMTTKEKESKWKDHSEKNLYNYLNITAEGVTYKDELYNDLTQVSDKEAHIKNKISGLRVVVKNRLQLIDGQIPESQKTAAQRHAMLNYLMIHKGWLSIALQRKFKSLQLNLENNQLEQGTYATVGNVISETVNNMRNYNMNIAKALKEAKNNPKFQEKFFGNEVNLETLKETLEKEGFSKDGLDDINDISQLETEVQGRIGDNERANKILTDYINNYYQQTDAVDLIERGLKRVGIEMSVMGIFIVIAAMISMAADDDDLEDIPGLQLTNYLMLRTANELASSQFGLPSQAKDAFTSPLSIVESTLKSVQDAPDIFSMETVQRGNYKGHSEAYQWFFRNIPMLKSVRDLDNIRETEQTYKFYNKQSLDMGSLWLYSILNSD